MRKLKYWLRLSCQWLLLPALLLWLWLLWQQPDPDLIVLPTLVVFTGLFIHRVFFPRLSDPWESWDDLKQTGRVGLSALFLVIIFHVLPLVSSLGAALAETPAAPPSLLHQITQMVIQGAYWVFAVVLALMTLLQLPLVRRWLWTWVTQAGAEP